MVCQRPARSSVNVRAAGRMSWLTVPPVSFLLFPLCFSLICSQTPRPLGRFRAAVGTSVLFHDGPRGAAHTFQLTALGFSSQTPGGAARLSPSGNENDMLNSLFAASCRIRSLPCKECESNFDPPLPVFRSLILRQGHIC